MEDYQREFFNDVLQKNSKWNGDCLEWTGKIHQGYGLIYAFKSMWSIHRVSYILKHGSIPEGLYVCHKCNNKKCFNPFHIYAGTAKENYNDMRNQPNYRDIFIKASKTRKKNNEEKMSKYQAEFLSVEDVADIFEVHPHTIRRAIREGFIIAIRIGNSPRSPYRISKKSIEAIHQSIIRELSKKSSSFS